MIYCPDPCGRRFAVNADDDLSSRHTSGAVPNGMKPLIKTASEVWRDIYCADPCGRRFAVNANDDLSLRHTSGAVLNGMNL